MSENPRNQIQTATGPSFLPVMTLYTYTEYVVTIDDLRNCTLDSCLMQVGQSGHVFTILPFYAFRLFGTRRVDFQFACTKKNAENGLWLRKVVLEFCVMAESVCWLR